MSQRKFAFVPLIIGLCIAGATEARADEKTYDNAIHSVAWIVSPVEQGNYDGLCSFGTAVVKSVGSRLLVTAYHVVEEREQVMVFFPRFDTQGYAIAETASYVESRATAGIEGKVVWRNSAKDLALIQLPSLPADVVAIKPAAAAPRPGQMIYAIGNSGFKNQVLWRLSSGVVRQTLHDYAFPLVTEMSGADHPQFVRGELLETQLAINEGDSGGPALNEAGELVGICSSQDPEHTLISYVVDLKEINALESSYEWDQVMKRPLTLPLNQFDLKPFAPLVLPDYIAIRRQQEEERNAKYRKIALCVIAGIIVLKWLTKK